MKPITKEEFKSLLDKFHDEIISANDLEEWYLKSNIIIKKYIDDGVVC